MKNKIQSKVVKSVVVKPCVLKSVVFKFFLGLLALCLFNPFNFNAFSRVILNGTTNVFSTQFESTTNMEVLVIEAAGYYLKSHSEYLALLNKIELSDIDGINYPELQAHIQNAVTNMELAKAKYTALVQAAGTAVYDPAIVAQLTAFNYSAFQTSNDLQKDLFDDVKSYLETGDVRGVYNELLSGASDVLDRLNFIKTDIDASQLPQMPELWRLNQYYAQHHLFGQYAAEVMYAITGKI